MRKHPEAVRRASNKYRRNNLDKIAHRKKERYNSDIQFRLQETLRNRIYSLIRNKPKVGSAVRDLGCSVDYLIEHIESLFTLKMTWDNYGTYWEIDHIQPLSSFDLTDRAQFLCAVNYTNLQPLTVEDNRRKGDKTCI